MRSMILGLSCFFLSASALLVGLALRGAAPLDPSPHLFSRETPAVSISAPSVKPYESAVPDSEKLNQLTADHPARPQRADPNQIAELKSTISQLESELREKQARGSTGQTSSILTLAGGVFLPGQIEPAPNASAALDSILAALASHPTDTVLVEGHADSFSAAPDSAAASEGNQKVSLLRAQAIAKLLEAKGIPGDRIVIRGYGDTRPLASNASPEGRSQNRRVEIKLIPTLGQ